MSRYTNYAMKNNVFGTLSAPISSLATTIQLATGQGQRFTADMLATLESMEGNKVTKREIVKITNVTGDTLTVIRKFAPCPSSDDANTQGQVSYSFSTDDTISVYISKEHFDKIDSSINDLYDNGDNRLYVSNAGGLKIHITGGNVRTGGGYTKYVGGDITLTDNATNYVMIDGAGTIQVSTSGWDDDYTRLAEVTTSDGVITNIERWKLDTIGGTFGVDIHSLPQKAEPQELDEILLADSADGFSNKKATIYDAVFSMGIDCLSERLLVGEKYTATDKLFKQATPTANDSTAEYNVGDTSTNTQIQIQRIASGIASNTITLKVRSNGAPTTALHCDVYEGEIYDISSTESAWKATGTALATSSLASSNFSSSWQEVTFTLNNNIGGTKGQLLSIVVYQDNNTVDASNYYIIACDSKQWSEAFRFIAYDNDNTYTPNYLMPYCISDGFAEYLLCKVDGAKQVTGFITIYDYTAPSPVYIQISTASSGVYYGPRPETFTNSTGTDITVQFKLTGYCTGGTVYPANFIGGGRANDSGFSYPGTSSTYTGTITVPDGQTYGFGFFNPSYRYMAFMYAEKLSYGITSWNATKNGDITGYSKNLQVSNIGAISRRVYLGLYDSNNYITSIGAN